MEESIDWQALRTLGPFLPSKEVHYALLASILTRLELLEEHLISVENAIHNSQQLAASPPDTGSPTTEVPSAAESGSTTQTIQPSSLWGQAIMLGGLVAHLSEYVDREGASEESVRIAAQVADLATSIYQRLGFGKYVPAVDAATSPSLTYTERRRLAEELYPGEGDLSSRSQTRRAIRRLQDRVRGLERGPDWVPLQSLEADAVKSPSMSSECCCDKTHYHEEEDGSLVGIRGDTGAVCRYCPVHSAREAWRQATGVLKVKLDKITTERNRYGAALARIRVITMRYEGGQTPVCALAGDIDDIAAEALKEVGDG